MGQLLLSDWQLSRAHELLALLALSLTVKQYCRYSCALCMAFTLLVTAGAGHPGCARRSHPASG